MHGDDAREGEKLRVAKSRHSNTQPHPRDVPAVQHARARAPANKGQTMTNRFAKFLMLGASPVMLAIAQPAFAQSTATQQLEAIESVTVSGQAVGTGGIMAPVTVAKERTTIGQDYIKTQAAGQSIYELLNKVPGFNFVNNDPYGNSGGNVRIHGFDGNHISFTWDGMPLNDTGNYATYTNQVADSEIIASASVNQGTTDVDSPTAAATGGVVSIVTARPSSDFGVQSSTSYGSYNYVREFLRVDSGEFGPWGTVAMATLSYTNYDKWKGPGHLEKKQFNAVVYQDLGDTGWLQLAAHWNTNRNNFYSNPTYYPVTSVGDAAGANFTTAATPVNGSVVTPTLAIGVNGAYTGTGAANNIAGFGYYADYQPTCTHVPGGPGAQLDTTCSSFYGDRLNPSDTGNIRLSSLFHLTDTLSFTFDPSIQYTLANGGGYTSLSETDVKLRGISGVGVDLNKDGDTLDTVGVYSPNNTNTIRYGLNTALVWRATPDHTFQFAYTLDFGLHRQTGWMGVIGPDGHPYDEFGGYRDAAHGVVDSGGVAVRQRDRRSHAILNQVAFAYEGNYFEDMLHVSAGLRSPFMTRDLNNLCFQQVTGGSAGFPTCTTAAPSAVAANGTVTLPGVAGALYTMPAQKTVNYNRLLPNAGFTLAPFGPQHTFYADYAAGIAAPRTDNLYNGGSNGKCQTPTTAGCFYSPFASVNPETSTNYDIGYRYVSDMVNLTLTAYNTQFKNRIVTSFDQDQGISVDRNIGSVNVDGVDAELDVRPDEGWDIYTSIAYNHSRVSASPLSTVVTSSTGAPINLAGKTLVETPAWTFAQRYEYKVAGFTFGLGGKYVSSRYITDANDYKVPSYATMDGDISYDLGNVGWEGSYVKLNGWNLTNERYLGNLSTKICYRPGVAGCTTLPTVTPGAPRTVQFTITSQF
jgi:iron complex outermembrane receptor protein